MRYRIYKLRFHTPVRFGNGADSESQMVFHGDTLFSALYLACRQTGREEALLSAVERGDLVFSDALPYAGDRLYLPRPMGIYPPKLHTEIDASTRKLLKKLIWIPSEQLADWLAGRISPHDLMVSFGTPEERTRVNRREEIPLPYPVQGFRFFPQCGLYLIAAAKDEACLAFADDALRLLSASGIGGSVSSGWGHFSVETAPVPPDLEQALENRQAPCQMLLSAAFPAEAESGVMENARCLLLRRGGFTAGRDEQPVKKKTSWLMAPGSVFPARFGGVIEDASTAQSSHPVYRCAKALMMGVNAE